MGFSEIRVLSDDGSSAYAAPNLIFHYILEHEYIPPDEFIQAVLKGAKPSSPEYERFLSSYEKYTLNGENAKNIQIVRWGENKNYIQIIKEFYNAINQGDLGKIRRLVDCSKEQVTTIMEFSKWLFIAASAGKLEVVNYLIHCGAEIDISTPNNNPLFGAIYGEHKDIVKLLIEKGIDTTIEYSNQFM